MTRRTRIAVVTVSLVSLAAFCAGCAEAPAVVGTTTEIPGVVAGGSPIQRLLEGYDGLDDPIGLMDGTLVFSEPDALRIHRLNTETNEASVLVADSNETPGGVAASAGTRMRGEG